MLHEIVLQFPDREETISTPGALPVELGGGISARGLGWLFERVEESDNPPKRRYICTRDWNDGALAKTVVAQFDPPGAYPAASKWRDEHEAILSLLPAEAIRIDVGRAVGGDFVRISVADEYADRFADA